MAVKAKNESEPIRLIVVSGDKGGVGKSFATLAIIDVLEQRGVRQIAIIETDTSNPDVARMYEDTHPCKFINLSSEEAWMDLMDFVVTHNDYTFIMNTPAGAGKYLKEYMPSFAAFVSQLKKPLSAELWWTMNPQHDSVNLLNEAVNGYGSHFTKIRVVCNTHFSDGKQDAFFLWRDSPLRKRLESEGCMTLYLPGLSLRVVAKLFAPERIMPFSDAVDPILGEKAGLLNSEQFKLKLWREHVKKEFDIAFDDTQKAAVVTEKEVTN